ncbi:ADP-ribose pyrophosphatase [Sulfitobacter sp. THAF37]|uniref:NUDIX domain-containing protein n=1 Tax=Sulfitobacter sp. THAF37 TaxID=2587855 RepID=UPI001267924E|nr:NUDIX domain-containing protein [Sulfitobacter sp. THAF37]QFT60031.1 ADP-ribose pyrophosphatase [Sulfitobacter sp. THAF37]
MRSLFFYGSLRHQPLLEIVLDRSADKLDMASAVLPGYATFAVEGAPFPVARPSAEGAAHGILVRGLTDAEVARLDFYEAGFGYELVEMMLADGQNALVYLSEPDRWTPAGPWSLAEWEAQWAALTCEAAREVMGYFGQRSGAEVAGMFPMIRKRAQSRLNARQSRHGTLTKPGRTVIEQRQRSYAHFFALDDMKVRFEHFDGSMSPVADRAVFIAADAALVLPYDPRRDRVLLVEQMRMGPLARGDRTVWQLEPIAGHIDPGEAPRNAAIREAREEAGLTLQAIEPIAEVYASPGNSTEFYYIFLGIADLPDAAEGIGGLPEEGEDIRAHVLSFDALMDLVDGFGAANAPLGLAAFWLARHRDRLRLSDTGDTPEAT